MKNDLVSKGYDKVALNYLVDRDQFQNIKYLEKLNGLLKASSRILDLGCGSGKPVDEFLVSKGYQVMGIDISNLAVGLGSAAFYIC